MYNLWNYVFNSNQKEDIIDDFYIIENDDLGIEKYNPKEIHYVETSTAEPYCFGINDNNPYCYATFEIEKNIPETHQYIIFN